MAKDKSDPITFIGGPYHFKQQNMNGCVKTHKIKSKDFVGHYERNSLYENNMIWKESKKRWYMVDKDAIVTDEKLKRLGCWAIVDSLSWAGTRENLGTAWPKLIRRVGIDIDSTYAAFELYYAEHIVYVSDYDYKTLYDFRGESRAPG